MKSTKPRTHIAALRVGSEPAAVKIHYAPSSRVDPTQATPLRSAPFESREVGVSNESGVSSDVRAGTGGVCRTAKGRRGIVAFGAALALSVGIAASTPTFAGQMAAAALGVGAVAHAPVDRLSCVLGARPRDAGHLSTSGPIAVTIAAPSEPWRLRRGGQPYLICGAGGWTTGDLEGVARAGGNSMRTWQSSYGVQELLDRGHELDVTVALGLAFAAENSSPGFYADDKAVAEQRAFLVDAVLAHRDHPALLLWGVGNELENGLSGGVPERIWREWGHLVRMVKQLDPNHPTMISIAEISEEKIRRIQQYIPDVDILGVNTYINSGTVGQRLKALGWTKPYVLSEFGPSGAWEAPRTPWKAPLEPTSHGKALEYVRGFERGVLENPRAAVGGYAFFFRHPHSEGTASWFPLIDGEGNSVSGLDALSERWRGRALDNRGPEIKSVSFDASSQYVECGTILTAKISATDPDGDSVEVHWELRADEWEYRTDGSAIDHSDIMPTMMLASPSETSGSTALPRGEFEVRFRAPSQEGPYRLYIRVTDGRGHVATASEPFFAQSPE